MTEGIPWKKLSSTVLALGEDQVLEKDGESEGPPVSCAGWWKLRPGRRGDSMADLSFAHGREGAGPDGPSSGAAGSDAGVGVEGGSMLEAGSCCW